MDQGTSQLSETMTLESASARIREISALLFDADFGISTNKELRDEAYAIMDAFPDQREQLHRTAMDEWKQRRRSQKLESGESIVVYDAAFADQKPAMVVIDGDKLRERFGRELTSEEKDVVAIMTDARANARSIEETAAAIFVFSGKIRENVLRALGV